MKLMTFEDIRGVGVTPRQCLRWVAESIAAKETAIMPPKASLHPGADGVFCNFMPCIITDAAGRKWGGGKIVTRYPSRNPALDSKLLLFDAETGTNLAFMDADWITAMRTGAVAAHSIMLLANEGFERVGIMGLGNTGRATMLMLAEALEGREVDIRLLAYKDQAESFKERFAAYPNLHFSTVDSAEKLARGAEVLVSCVTYLADDICSDDCFDPGITVVPVHTRGFTNCDLFFDKVFADDYGHVHHFKNFGKFASFAEVADVVNGRAPGRESAEERILVYNIGVSMHDVAFAAKIYQMAKLGELSDIDMQQPSVKFWV